MTFIPVAKPFFDEEEVEAAKRVILSGWVSQGPEVALFENEFAEYVGSQHAVAVSNCTTALHLSLLAAGVGPGDEVITTTHSFIATANAIRYCGAKPIFIDIATDTFNIDAKRITAAITPRTTAILCVHQMGMPCDYKKILEIGKKYSLPVIEDAACAVGSEVKTETSWQKIGVPHGRAACFSFHPRKVLTTGEGGMITTDSGELAQKFRFLRQHGMSVPDTVRHGAKQVIFEAYPEHGFNYRMTDIQAAIGRVQLKKLADMVAKRRQLAADYEVLLAEIEGIRIPTEPLWARSNWQSYCIGLPPGCNQLNVMQKMLDDDIATRRGIMCIHREKPYHTESANSLTFHNSEFAQDNSIILPLYHSMTQKDQYRVVNSLMKACIQ
jgi:dTDP-4-amino-4,6-dideoxygalactose transaminase